MTCCFFGHRDTPSYIADQLLPLLCRLVEERKIDLFLVGNEGAFDRMAASALAELKKEHPSVRCYTVLAYMPKAQSKPLALKTIYPECLECVPKRFAIDRRNRWMIKQSDMVICYVRTSISNSARYVETAKNDGKTVLNLAEDAK